MAFEKQYLMEGNPAHEHASVEAALVFVDYGVTAPERHYDDYIGIDVKGKIVVVVTGAPPSFFASDRAMYSDDFVKSKNAAARGAIGSLGIWAGEVTSQVDGYGVRNGSEPPYCARIFWQIVGDAFLLIIALVFGAGVVLLCPFKAAATGIRRRIDIAIQDS